MRQLREGSQAIAQAVAACRPRVVSAYPITPQTHIVEGLAEMAARGELAAECLNVESEFAAASVVLGATAQGSRAYTATSSQGLLLMAEVLYNIAGLRLPVVLTCANRAVSAPLSIWNDHQDVMAVRDAGWIQLFAADNQEAADLHPQAYRLAESLRVPVMVNVDGFILTHAFEPVDVLDQEVVDRFLPEPSLRLLDPQVPRSIGMMAEPNTFLETRYVQHQAVRGALEAIPEIGRQFRELFGRPGVQLIKTYRLDDATTALVSLGSLAGTVREAIDRLRDRGSPVGAIEIQTYRPFPSTELRRLLRNVDRVAVLEKAVAPGTTEGGIVATEIKDALYGLPKPPVIRPYILGLGGRDITVEDIRHIAEETQVASQFDERDEEGDATVYERFVGLNRAVLGDTWKSSRASEAGQPHPNGSSGTLKTSSNRTQGVGE
jgi:pyruvate ferredoxin oxidoreductase alpha subunit